MSNREKSGRWDVKSWCHLGAVQQQKHTQLLCCHRDGVSLIHSPTWHLSTSPCCFLLPALPPSPCPVSGLSRQAKTAKVTGSYALCNRYLQLHLYMCKCMGQQCCIWVRVVLLKCERVPLCCYCYWETSRLVYGYNSKQNERAAPLIVIFPSRRENID